MALNGVMTADAAVAELFVTDNKDWLYSSFVRYLWKAYGGDLYVNSWIYISLYV